MQINIEELDSLVKKADEIFLTPEGEKVLVKLLSLQEQIEQAIDEAKFRLADAALKVNPNFKSIQSDKIKVAYRSFGQKYYVDETQLDLAPKELYEAVTKVSYVVDAKKVDEWVDKNKGMPAGIKEVEREKKITFSLKVNEKE